MNTYRLGKYRVLEDGTEETYNIFATNKKCIVKQLLYNKRLWYLFKIMNANLINFDEKNRRPT